MARLLEAVACLLAVFLLLQSIPTTLSAPPPAPPPAHPLPARKPAQPQPPQHGPKPPPSGSKPAPKPFYAIAHRVLTSAGVVAALKHGANAIEVDFTAQQQGWWADHDRTPTSRRDTAEAVLKTIADQRRRGMTVGFVWFDIKNPDAFPASNKAASIEALRDLARKHLEPVGIGALYGFYNWTAWGRAYAVLSADLHRNEALNHEGPAAQTTRLFNTRGPANVAQRVLSVGALFKPSDDIGVCASNGGGICPQLRIGATSHDFGQVLGWTVVQNSVKQAYQMMGEAGVDGVIYGFAETDYADHLDTRGAFGIVRGWLDKNKDKRYLATNADKLW
ncbi:phospholipase D [Purpureocillium lilacinum]|uniref:Phospholipase D n=1 Tax=Purpureocillium lilacinum TaxID=33203 RepID=A0A179GKM4_PURLI|nr:phospholipase D [Purpureocillium lilacinum]